MKAIAKVVLILTLVMLVVFYEGLNIVYVDNQTHVDNPVDASKFNMEISLGADNCIYTYGWINLGGADLDLALNGGDLKLLLVPVSRVEYSSPGDYFFDDGYIYVQGYDDYHINVEDIYISVFYDDSGMLSASAVNYSVPFAFPQILSSFALIFEFSLNNGIDIDFKDNENALDYLEDIGYLIGYPIFFIYRVFGLFSFASTLLGVVSS